MISGKKIILLLTAVFGIAFSNCLMAKAISSNRMLRAPNNQTIYCKAGNVTLDSRGRVISGTLVNNTNLYAGNKQKIFCKGGEAFSLSPQGKVISATLVNNTNLYAANNQKIFCQAGTVFTLNTHGKLVSGTLANNRNLYGANKQKIFCRGGTAFVLEPSKGAVISGTVARNTVFRTQMPQNRRVVLKSGSTFSISPVDGRLPAQ